MANDTITNINKPAPYIESELKAFLPQLGKLGATSIPATQLGLPSIAGESAFTDQARKSAAQQAGLTYDPTTQALSGTGVAAYQPYLTTAATYADPSTTAGQAALQNFISPQQQYVIDAMTDETTRAKTAADAAALQSGAFGGGRAAVQQGILDAELAKNIGMFKNQMYTQGLDQMGGAADRQRALAGDVQQLGLGNIGLLGQAGTGQLAYDQAVKDAAAQSQRMQTQAPFDRLGWYGGQLAQLMGGMPNPYMQQGPEQQAPSPLFQAIASGAGAYGLGGILGKIWNKGN